MQQDTPIAEAITEVTRAVVTEVVKRNEQLPPTEAIKITTMAGCAAVTKK
jgi:ATP-binding protein involved in chromosome partitioning